jgi:Na+/melibiose symporter-like transporter
MGLIKRTKFVFGEVGQGLKLKELYTAVIFQAILGAVVPNFSSYLYYYQISVAGFTQFEYSMLQMIGYATLISGSVCFNLFLKDKEFTVMMFVACLVNCVGSMTTMLFCL